MCRELGIIQHAYEIACKEWNYPLPLNPVAAVRKPEIRNKRERRLGFQELKALFKALDACQNPQMRLLVLFAIATGMRRGEMLAAEWRYVSFDNRTLHIPITKTGYARTIPLTKRALRLLYALKRITGAELKIFSITEEAFRTSWRRMIKRAGVSDLHFHDFRHEAISRFFERGLSVPEVALISGHKDFMMLARYTHMKAEDIAKRLNA